MVVINHIAHFDASPARVGVIYVDPFSLYFDGGEHGRSVGEGGVADMGGEDVADEEDLDGGESRGSEAGDEVH